MDPVELLSTLGNKYNPEILQTTYEPKSAQELSEELDIPIDYPLEGVLKGDAPSKCLPSLN